MAERLYPNITLFAEIFLFLLIFMLLSKFLFKPVLRILAERRKRIEGQREDARKFGERTRTILTEYDSKISQAKKKASSIIDGFKREGEDESRELLASARAFNEKYYGESKQKIWADAQNLKIGLSPTAEEISNDLASKILQ